MIFLFFPLFILNQFHRVLVTRDWFLVTFCFNFCSDVDHKSSMRFSYNLIIRMLYQDSYWSSCISCVLPTFNTVYRWWWSRALDEATDVFVAYVMRYASYSSSFRQHFEYLHIGLLCHYIAWSYDNSAAANSCNKSIISRNSSSFSLNREVVRCSGSSNYLRPTNNYDAEKHDSIRQAAAYSRSHAHSFTAGPTHPHHTHRLMDR